MVYRYDESQHIGYLASIMRVAINGRFIQQRLEGIGQYTVAILEELSQLYDHVEWHVVLDRQVYHHLFDRPNVFTHTLYPSARHPLLWTLWFDYRLPRLLSEIDPDVFFSPDGFVSLRTSVPTIVTIHDLAFLDRPNDNKRSHQKYMSDRVSLSLDRADDIITISHWSAQRLRTHFPQLSTPVHIIPNGISRRFVPISSKDQKQVREQYTHGRRYLLYVGAIHPRKNILTLLKAFASYKDSVDDDLVLLIVGRMAWKTTEVHVVLRAMKEDGRVIYLDKYIDDIASIMAAAECLCYISLLEGFGLPTLEALACGVPVITSKNSAMEEVCGDHATYIDPMDQEDICHAIKKLIGEKKCHQNQSRESRIRHAQAYSWTLAAQQIYKRLSQYDRGSR